MASRHIPTQRLMSGVLFSAPNDMQAMPAEGWGGEGTPFYPRKKTRSNIQGLENPTPIGRCINDYPTGETAEPSISVPRYDDPPSVRNLNCFAQYTNFCKAPQDSTSKRPLSPDTPGPTLCLPVLSVSLTATVDGTLAHTELTQVYQNPSEIIIPEAKHVFPLYDGVVITSFECTIGDERRIRGVVKPRAQARREYEEALQDRVKAPALLEEHTPEIFETSLGNIPAMTTLEIKITYVQQLKVVMMETQATEGIALIIPTSIAPRYSRSPPEWEPLSRLPVDKLDIWVKVVDDGRVKAHGRWSSCHSGCICAKLLWPAQEDPCT
ncbi:hypothetical protein DER46DRAFT_611667 [Fusarium sp. MPI-SDFR-AT-0072]|nr:hypothetical protein DER46DRAFT_611667 [Fusarium sp. MPI-SDFR-AT-0072]